MSSWCVPGAGIDRTDRAAGDIHILQRFEVQLQAIQTAEKVGQGAEQLCKFARFGLRFLDADGLEAESRPGRGLRRSSPEPRPAISFTARGDGPCPRTIDAVPAPRRSMRTLSAAMR